jgi:hypothetical protein
MNKFASVLLIGSILSVPAAGQVRPGDCRPVLPVLDKAVAVVPQDVVVPQAAPVVPAAHHFFGLPFLIPLIAIGGACVIECGTHNHGTPTPTPTPPPVSPA